MCDVPSIAVFCSESIECFPDTASKIFLKLLVTIPVAPIIIGILLLFYILLFFYVGNGVGDDGDENDEYDYDDNGIPTQQMPRYYMNINPLKCM